MENNKNVLRYISCACFGVCTLLTIGQLIDYFRYSYPFYPIIFAFADFVLLIAAMAIVIAALITKKQILLLVGGGVGVLYSIIQLFFNVRNFYYGIIYGADLSWQLPYLFTGLLLLGSWAVILAIALMGKQYGKILGIIGGVVWAINRIIIMILNQMIFIGTMSVMKFRLYTICFLAGIVLLGLIIDSFPSTESVPFGASGQYGAGAPDRQFRRYDASAPGGGPGPQNYNYSAPGGAQQRYQAPGGGPAQYNYQAPGGGQAQQNYQAPGGRPAQYNYQAPGGAQQNYQAPGGWTPQNYQAPGGGAAPQNDSAPDGSPAPNDYSAPDSVSPFFYNPGKSDEDAPL